MQTAHLHTLSFLCLQFTGGASNLVILSASGILTEFSNLYLEKLNDGMLLSFDQVFYYSVLDTYACLLVQD